MLYMVTCAGHRSLGISMIVAQHQLDLAIPNTAGSVDAVGPPPNGRILTRTDCRHWTRKRRNDANPVRFRSECIAR